MEMPPLDLVVKERLNKKLVDTVNHLKDIESKKKEANEGFKEDIKGAKARINCLAETIKKEDLGFLQGVFFDSEIEAMTSGRPLQQLNAKDFAQKAAGDK